jgi:hypothetical protein
MTDRPILFSAPMVRALLDGRKTQTRRVLKPQPAKWEARVVDIREPDFDEEYQQWGQWETVWNRCSAMWEPEEDIFHPLRLHFAVGDRLWVRETWCAESSYDDTKPSLIQPDACNILYVADDRWSDRDQMNRAGKTRVSIFMPRWASRLTLTVTDVRVEQLQNCSEADAIAEGIEQHGRFYGLADADWDDAELSAVAAYHRLWNSISGEGAWEANPWVCAVSFSIEHGNIDR